LQITKNEKLPIDLMYQNWLHHIQPSMCLDL
jgi:hypothetical protein